MGLLVLGVVVSPLTASHAQDTTKSAPSPVAPGDLSKPVFDTTKPVYDSIPSLDKNASTVVAEVEGRPITLGDVGDAIRALTTGAARLPFETLFPSVLDQLVRQQALVVRAQQQGLDEDPPVRRRMRAASDRILANEYLNREISKGVTEAALLERYNRDIAGHPGPDEVRSRIILVSTEKEALDLIAEIRGGADFAAVARRSSKDPSASIGGDLGFNTRDGLTPEIGAVAFALADGQMAAYPVRSVGAWFVLKTEERRQEPTPSFALAREQLTQELLREGVIPLTLSVLAPLKVREYNILGKEADKPEQR